MPFTSLVGAGQSVREETITSGSQLLNGKATSCTISISGVQQVINGSAYDTQIISGGRQQINGGLASNSHLQGSSKLSSYQVVGPKSLAKITTIKNLGYQVLIGGSASNTKIQSGGLQFVSSGQAQETTINQGTQVVWGKSLNTTLKNGGRQIISQGVQKTDSSQFKFRGEALSTTISKSSLQQLIGGKAGQVSILQGGSQYVLGGVASQVTVKASGLQYIAGGKAQKVTLEERASQIVSKGQVSLVKIKGGMQYLYRGKAKQVTILNGGTQYVLGGEASHVTVKASGLQYVSGGRAQNVTLEAKASQIVAKGTVSLVKVGSSAIQYVSGGQSLNTWVHKGGLQQVHSAIAKNTKVTFSATQNVLYSGVVQNSEIHGVILVKTLGKAQNCTICTSGQGAVFEGGVVQKLTVKSGGLLIASNGAKLRDITLLAGAKLSIAAKEVLNGANSFRGSTVLGGTNTEGVSLASKATLSLKGKNDLSQLHFKVGAGTFNLKSQGNTLGILATQAKSKINFELNSLTPSNQPLLKLLNTNTSHQGSFSLKVSTSQKLGSYILTKNWQPTKAPSFNLYLDNKKQGSLKIEGSTLVLNGVSYSLKKVDSTIKVDLEIKAGQILAKNSAKIVGTSHSDIISGQNGNNLIEGKNGRDVLIYDTSNWGKDIVAKTKGTITLLFSGLKARDLNLNSRGQDLLITRKDKPKQEILLKNYDKARHSLVYTNSLQAFSSYLKAASPTESMQEKVKKEVWQKAGLAKA